MPEGTYIALALGTAVAITVALRAVPFAAKNALRDTPVIADLSRWMPLGAVAILAIYCLSSVDVPAALQGSPQAVGPIVGTAVTVAVHLWRRNAAVSILTGSLACLVIVNAL